MCSRVLMIQFLWMGFTSVYSFPIGGNLIEHVDLRITDSKTTNAVEVDNQVGDALLDEYDEVFGDAETFDENSIYDGDIVNENRPLKMKVFLKDFVNIRLTNDMNFLDTKENDGIGSVSDDINDVDYDLVDNQHGDTEDEGISKDNVKDTKILENVKGGHVLADFVNIRVTNTGDMIMETPVVNDNNEDEVKTEENIPVIEPEMNEVDVEENIPQIEHVLADFVNIRVNDNGTFSIKTEDKVTEVLADFVNIRVTDTGAIIVETEPSDNIKPMIIVETEKKQVLVDFVNIRVTDSGNIVIETKMKDTDEMQDEIPVEDVTKEVSTEKVQTASVKTIIKEPVTETVQILDITTVTESTPEDDKDIEVVIETIDDDEDDDVDIGKDEDNVIVKDSSGYSPCVSVDAAHIGNTLQSSFPVANPYRRIPPKFTVQECWQECQNNKECQFWNFVDETYGGIVPERFIGSCYLKTRGSSTPKAITGYVGGVRDCHPTPEK